ncbi:hypothetical protein D1B31_18270 [Neobacillus notoginsengisoli]|uniref:Peptidase S24/S26A/S26B/S26C domain-containing protein n=1 Tax=Neobacillus notoginsengisoli TaxID=1578198 RepID=A0A417YQA3_9BACI|nr:S24/S26 family peptidase [Neobacillus notoginsengisoli]RHW36030.1 hypothetical protein D1B31_18270 [Neobacillus notoginsengisoli]
MDINFISKAVNSNRKVKFTIQGISMEDTFYHGDTVFIEAKKDYKENDIVVIKDMRGYLISHRLVFIEPPYILTLGDNNKCCDAFTDISKIVGFIRDPHKTYSNKRILNLKSYSWKEFLKIEHQELDSRIVLLLSSKYIEKYISNSNFEKPLDRNGKYLIVYDIPDEVIDSLVKTAYSINPVI